jgi:hypothetical protein
MLLIRGMLVPGHRHGHRVAAQRMWVERIADTLGVARGTVYADLDGGRPSLSARKVDSATLPANTH